VLLAFLVSFKVMLFDERYLIASAPFLYMVVAAAVAEVLLWRKQGPPVWQGWSALATLGLYSFLLIVSLYNYFFAPRFGREQWREAVAYVESEESGKTVIIFDPGWLYHCYDYYQTRSLPYLSLTDGSQKGSVASPVAMRAQVAGYDSIWLIRSHSDSTAIQDTLKAQFTQDSYRAFPKGEGIAVWHFRAGQR
jgi:hypothetical protein